MFKKNILSAAASLLFFSGAVGASSLPKPEPLTAPKNPDEELAFVFELVRHGARAPIEDRDLDKFTVGEGLLTPEGMRQRYLLGQHNRRRYVEAYNFISETYTPGEIYMQSTNVNRTMQSGYSELMGLYPPGAGERLTPEQSKAIGTFSAPPFGVRDADKINDELKDEAMPNSYVQVPLTEFNNDDIHDDVSTSGCNLINQVGHVLEWNDTYWEPYEWMQKQTEGSVEAALDLTQEYVDNLKTWHEYQVLTDTVVALDFEGYPEHSEFFSDDQWELTNEYQHIWLIDDYTQDARDLMMSRMLRKPLAIMQSKVGDMLGKEVDSEMEYATVTEEETKDLKYIIYSAHDTQVVNMMGFLQKDFDWVTYASTVIFELKYSEQCLAGANADESCFGVSVIFNGKPQLFDGCTGALFTLEGCKFPEFLDYVNTRWYSGPAAPDLNAACHECYGPDCPQE